MTCASQDLVIRKGATFSVVIRWESPPYIYKAITAITKAAPVRITATGHGVPDGWRVAVMSAGGMRQINAKNNPPRENEFRPATVVDANTVDLNEVNSLDFNAYTSGGTLIYRTPVDLTGATARMQIRDTAESEDILFSLTTENGRIIIDNTAKTITLKILAVDTDDLPFLTGVYDLEFVAADATVTALLQGTVTVEAEVTR